MKKYVIFFLLVILVTPQSRAADLSSLENQFLRNFVNDFVVLSETQEPFSVRIIGVMGGLNVVKLTQ